SYDYDDYYYEDSYDYDDSYSYGKKGYKRNAAPHSQKRAAKHQSQDCK
ncbi:39459_t:CDS:2, partial [Gigaspora margarita]